MTKVSVAISVVITNYNYDRYIGSAIDSVLAQTRPVDEIIVLDDGSTDNSRIVMQSYAGKIRTIFKDNEGQAATKNRAFQEAKGDIVLCLDADDLLYPRAIELIERAWTPDTAKAQFDLDVIDGNGRLLGRRFCNFSLPISPEKIARQFRATGTYLWPVTSGNAYGKGFLRQVLPLAPPGGHDGVLNTIAPLYGAVQTIAQPLGQYRLHGRNTSRLTSSGTQRGYPDFAHRIRLRRMEFDIMREHAGRLGAEVPPENLLDNELVFVNYRLMARKLGERYDDQERDSAAGLWRRGLGVAFFAQTTVRTKFAHAAWLTLLAFSPRAWASQLIMLRFNRAEFISRLKQAVSFRAAPAKAERTIP